MKAKFEGCYIEHYTSGLFAFAFTNDANTCLQIDIPPIERANFCLPYSCVNHQKYDRFISEMVASFEYLLDLFNG
jgi:hypothetical protein